MPTKEEMAWFRLQAHAQQFIAVRMMSKRLGISAEMAREVLLRTLAKEARAV